MATVLLAAAGSAIGGTFGGTVLGLTGAAIGQAVGATLGSLVDNRVMGGGSQSVEGPRLDTFRIQSAQEGTGLPYVAGRMRVAGQMIWSTRFLETINKETQSSGGGKGSAPKNTVTTTSYSYSVSFALALCEGRINRIGRIWADGKQLDQSSYTIRVYSGADDQQPDPKIAAVEGIENAPAYRGTAYIVFDDMQLARFGNRMPQINVEVFRLPQVSGGPSLLSQLKGTAVIPGTGEYALSTQRVNYVFSPGTYQSANVNNDAGVPDIQLSLDHMQGQLSQLESALLVVSWFGDDLRAGQCRLEPKVEQNQFDGDAFGWQVSSMTRATGALVSRTDDRVNYGGTPSDQSVIEAIQTLKARGKAVTFYPFILMDIMSGNGLADPYGGVEQAAFPWRGRIKANTTADVAAFFGTAQVGHFSSGAGTVNYSGPADWGLRRFVLHYAHLCAMAGGVEAFCIGSEMRGLTWSRDGANYPAVAAFKALAADVRTILGAGCKLTYAADWSEYFGHHPGDGSGDVIYHLDPLWADPNIDMVGIDNYMPLSDWRDGHAHLDAETGVRSVYELDYLKSNIEGGEGYAWYYESDVDRAAQIRSPITDGAYGDDHVFRPKDIRNWWGRPHFNRPGGIRDVAQTAWIPRSKPIWFTEYGCPAIDKGTNQPNVFVDEKSSENAAPYFSTGARDDFIQYQYLQAMTSYWAEAGRNPTSEIYNGPMLDMTRAHVWAWDARPWPDFPFRESVWSDGPNYRRGHWISGRLEMAPLADLVREICARSGVDTVDVSRLYGAVTGYEIKDGLSARAALQPLMAAYGFDCFERDGGLVFVTRDGFVTQDLSGADFVLEEDRGAAPMLTRAAESELPDRVQAKFVNGDHSYQRGVAEATRGDVAPLRAQSTDLPIAMNPAKAQAIAERWIVEGVVARDTMQVTLPPSIMGVEPGDIVALSSGHYQIDRIEDIGARKIEARRVDPGAYVEGYHPEPSFEVAAPPAIGQPLVHILDLPLLRGDEVAHAPHIAASAQPWPGAVDVFMSSDPAGGYLFNTRIERPSTIGVLEQSLTRTAPSVWAQNTGFVVRISHGTLSGRSTSEVLNGANVAALRNSASGDWEVVQFQSALLIADNVYALDGILRGQAGTEHIIPDIWPSGTDFVVLDGAAVQLELPPSARGLERHLRIGPASESYNSDSYVSVSEAFAGVGLRPYAPVHLTVMRTVSGDIAVSWVRRSRIDADLWDGDVPLGEERELYQITLEQGGTSLQTYQSDTAALTIPMADLPVGAFEITVGQMSARYGVGAIARMNVDD